MASTENTDSVVENSSPTPARTLLDDMFSSSVTLNKGNAPHNDHDAVLRGETMVEPSSMINDEEARRESDSRTVTPPQGSEAPPKSEYTSSDCSDERPYSIFSKRRKKVIAAMSALSSALSPLAAISYFPALNSIREVYKKSKISEMGIKQRTLLPMIPLSDIHAIGVQDQHTVNQYDSDRLHHISRPFTFLLGLIGRCMGPTSSVHHHVDNIHWSMYRTGISAKLCSTTGDAYTSTHRI